MSNFGRGSPKEPSCKIISKSVQPFSRKSRDKVISIYSHGGHFVQRRRNLLSNFGRGSFKKHSCVIISKSLFWFMRRSHFKVFLFLALVAILFNGFLVGCFGFYGPLRQYFSLYRAVSHRQKRAKIEKKCPNKPPPAPTASAIGPCPTIIQTSRTPRH